MTQMIEIDGSNGEGGGQILRTSLAAAMATGQPLRICNIRAGRAKPGLLRQHLTCAKAAAAITGGDLEGAVLGAGELVFHPGKIQPGAYEFAIGTAGSCHLVLQTILPVLLTATGASKLVLEGGTHNPSSPPYEFIERAYLPVLRKMGAQITSRIERYGFMPAGGGRIVVDIEPVNRLEQIDVIERGEVSEIYAEGFFANLPFDIVERELATLGDRLKLDDDQRRVREVKSHGPGNALMLTVIADGATEVVAEFGRRGVSAANVANGVASLAERYLKSSAAVGPYLADQLLLPMALAGGGRFSTLRPTRHSLTNMETIQAILPVRIAQASGPNGKHHVISVETA